MYQEHLNLKAEMDLDTSLPSPFKQRLEEFALKTTSEVQELRISMNNIESNITGLTGYQYSNTRPIDYADLKINWENMKQSLFNQSLHNQGITGITTTPYMGQPYNGNPNTTPNITNNWGSFVPVPDPYIKASNPIHDLISDLGFTMDEKVKYLESIGYKIGLENTEYGTTVHVICKEPESSSNKFTGGELVDLVDLVFAEEMKPKLRTLLLDTKATIKVKF